MPSASEKYYDGRMLDFVRFAGGVITDLFRPRVTLVAENAMLRQQLIVAERKLVGRVRWAPWQRYALHEARSRRSSMADADSRA